MAYSIGTFIGALFAPVFFSWLLDGILFKSQEPDRRAISVAASVYLVISTIAMFGMADGGPLVLGAYLLYLPGALLAWLMLRRKYRKLWQDIDPDVFS